MKPIMKVAPFEGNTGEVWVEIRDRETGWWCQFLGFAPEVFERAYYRWQLLGRYDPVMADIVWTEGELVVPTGEKQRIAVRE